MTRLLAVLSLFSPTAAIGGEMPDIGAEVRGDSPPPVIRVSRTRFPYDFTWLYHAVGVRARPSGCPCHPSCSAYIPQCIRDYGVIGLALAFDRILREHEDMASRRWVWFEGAEKLHDPVEDNVYWWKESRHVSGAGALYLRELRREWTGVVRRRAP
ncbi:membrane protein insertion efficiency factor YidD [Verrucomicrobiota bacterium]